MAQRFTYPKSLRFERLRSKWGGSGADLTWLRREHRGAGHHGYTTRFLLCLVASLLVVIAAVRIPLGGNWTSVGWHVIHPKESISVYTLHSSTGEITAERGAPVTVFQDENAPSPPVGDGIDAGIGSQSVTDDVTHHTAPPLERMAGRRIFEAAHDMPRIIGGMGAYYIHIEYPQEALDAGIEGRLLLGFIVEEDGRTTAIEVIHGLHPACDSAAVQALRQTRFVPGRLDGEIVPVRMRLPVRFQLIEAQPATAGDA